MNSRCATSMSFISEKSFSSRFTISFVTATCRAASASSYASRTARTPRTTGTRIRRQNPRRIFCCVVQFISGRNRRRRVLRPGVRSDFLDQQHLLHIVNLLQFDFDDLVRSGLYHTSHEASFDREFAPTAID